MSINPAGGHEGRRAMTEGRKAQTLRALADYMRGRSERQTKGRGRNAPILAAKSGFPGLDKSDFCVEFQWRP